MSADRARRAERVIELRQRAVDAAQTEHAAAARAVLEAEMVSRDSESLYLREAAAIESDRYASSIDLATSSAWLKTLRQRADQAAVKLAEAQAESAHKHQALVGARSELRRMEIWRDGLVAAARAVLERKQRTAEDEVATRTVRRHA
jgi:hypothetical protein